MIDHAAIVRSILMQTLSVTGPMYTHDDYDAAAAALAALEQELAEARDRAEGWQYESEAAVARAETAEAALAEAKQRIAYLTAEAHGWQPKLAKAEEALREREHLTRRMFQALDGYWLHCDGLPRNRHPRSRADAEDWWTRFVKYRDALVGEDAL